MYVKFDFPTEAMGGRQDDLGTKVTERGPHEPSPDVELGWEQRAVVPVTDDLIDTLGHHALTFEVPLPGRRRD